MIEQTLERIAVALEKIASQMGNPIVAEAVEVVKPKTEKAKKKSGPYSLSEGSTPAAPQPEVDPFADQGGGIDFDEPQPSPVSVSRFKTAEELKGYCMKIAGALAGTKNEAKVQELTTVCRDFCKQNGVAKIAELPASTFLALEQKLDVFGQIAGVARG